MKRSRSGQKKSFNCILTKIQKQDMCKIEKIAHILFLPCVKIARKVTIYGR